MKIKEKIIYWLAKHLLPFVEERDVMVVKSGKVFINGVELTESEKISLRGEAHILEQLRIWKIINANLSDVAKKKMFLEATDITGLLFGKTILYCLDVQRQIVSKISSLKD
jgi:hypothetical protein